MLIANCICGAHAELVAHGDGHRVVQCTACWNATPRGNKPLHPDTQISKWNDLMRELGRLKSLEDMKNSVLDRCLSQRLISFDNTAVNQLILHFESTSISLEAEVQAGIPRIIASYDSGDKSNGRN